MVIANHQTVAVYWEAPDNLRCTTGWFVLVQIGQLVLMGVYQKESTVRLVFRG